MSVKCSMWKEKTRASLFAAPCRTLRISERTMSTYDFDTSTFSLHRGATAGCDVGGRIVFNTFAGTTDTIAFKCLTGEQIGGRYTTVTSSLALMNLSA